jgi:hypothetical protein
MKASLLSPVFLFAGASMAGSETFANMSGRGAVREGGHRGVSRKGIARNFRHYLDIPVKTVKDRRFTAHAMMMESTRILMDGNKP